MRIAFLIFLLTLFCLGTPDAHARGKIRTIEAQNFIILFSPTGKTTKVKDPIGKNQKMIELSYKLVNRAESPRELFSSSGWASVRFQDREGYDLFEDSVSLQGFDKNRDYYGFVWAEKKRVKKVARIRVTPILARRLAEIQEQQGRWGKPLENQLERERKIRHEKMEKKIRKSHFWKNLNPLRIFKKKKKPIASYFVQEPSKKGPEQVKEEPRRKKEAAPQKPKLAEQVSVEEADELEMEQVLEELEAINYEDTDATYQLNPDEEMMTEQDVATHNAQHDATEGMDATATLVGAETNDDVTTLLDALKEIPPTIENK